jgi:hypothetical protein
MAKVRYLQGDTAGTVGYMSHPEIQEALKGNPDALEILDGAAEAENEGARQEGAEVDNAERGDVRRSPVAARDLSEEEDPTVVRTAGHGVAGADAMRIGESVTHTAEPLPVTSAGPKDAEGVDPLEETRNRSQADAGRQNERAEGAREQGRKAAKAAEKNRRTAAPEKGDADTAGGSADAEGTDAEGKE